jgi:hypothetical protein
MRPLASSSSHSTSRPPVTKPTQRRRPISSTRSSLRDFEGEESSKQATQRLNTTATQPVDTRLQRRRLLGTGRETDAGSECQLLHDDCVFLCTSLMQSKQYSSQTTLRVASDLLLLLSVQSNREKLFLLQDSSAALGALLDLFASCAGQEEVLSHQEPSSPKRIRSGLSSVASSPSSTKSAQALASTPDRPPYSRDVLDAIAMSLYFFSLDCTLSEQGAPGSDAAKARRIRHQVLSHPQALQGIISLVRSNPLLASLRDTTTLSASSLSPMKSVHVVVNDSIKNGALLETGDHGEDGQFSVASSIADTNSVISSSQSTVRSIDPTKSGRQRRKQRRLQHPLGIEVEPTNDSTNKANETEPEKGVERKNDSNKTDGDIFLFPSSQESAFSSSQSISSSVDPTKAGRHRRKRRRQRELAAIPENNHVEADAFSFPSLSTTETRKERQLEQPQNGSKKELNDVSPGNESQTKADANVPSLPSSQFKNDKSDLQSVVSTDIMAVKTRQNLEMACARIMASMPSQTLIEEASHHTCGKRILTDEHTITDAVHTIPLVALTRILTGKMEWSDKSCMDDVVVGNGSNGQDCAGSPRDEEEEEDCNPLLLTNRLLGENGSIPLLSQAFAETQAAVIHQVRSQENGDKPCRPCITFLHDRVTFLTSLVDDACLLNNSNRQGFCREGYTPESGGYLVVGLFTVLQTLLHHDKLYEDDNTNGGVWSEIGLETLRALTSLTHENTTAVKELEACSSLADAAGDGADGKGSKGYCGLAILTQVLHKAVTSRNEGDTKLRYDSVIFCLNSLTNCVESSEAAALILADTKLIASQDEAASPNFLKWLTSWLAGETKSFREAVLDSTFGSSESKHFERRLEKHEDDRVVTAGNGFVLLACLMIHDSTDEKTGITPPRDLILAELPGDSVESKLSFVKNTLTAFCNFYHYSVGDLSIAVVKPIKKLIAQMEAIPRVQEGMDD